MALSNRQAVTNVVSQHCLSGPIACVEFYRRQHIDKDHAASRHPSGSALSDLTLILTMQHRIIFDMCQRRDQAWSYRSY